MPRGFLSCWIILCHHTLSLFFAEPPEFSTGGRHQIRPAMDLDTVIDLVAALVASYNDGAEFYARWQRRNWRSNNYMNHAKGASAGSGGCCGLSASLTYSAHRIREAFDKGARILGKDFSVGDGMFGDSESSPCDSSCLTCAPRR